MEQKANENENENEKKSENKKGNDKHKPLNIIEDYVSSESTAESSKHANIAPSLPPQTKSASTSQPNETSSSRTQSQSQVTAKVARGAPAKPKVVEAITNAEDGDNIKSTENETQFKSSKEAIEAAQYNSVMTLLSLFVYNYHRLLCSMWIEGGSIDCNNVYCVSLNLL